MFNGDRVSVEEGEKFRRWMMVRVAGQGECTCYLWLKQYVVTLCDFYHNRKKKTQMARSRMDTAKNRGSHLADSHEKIPNRCSLNAAGLRTQTPAQ